MPLPFDLRVPARRCASLNQSPRCGRSRRLPLALLATSLALGAACVSCSTAGSGTSSAPATPTVTVRPNSAQPFAGSGVQFGADVQNASNSAVTWRVNQTPGGNPAVGTIDATGYYVAPSVPPASGTVTVTAVLQADPSVSGSASVAIQGSLTVAPARASLTTSQSLQLQVATAGVSASDVTWTADGGSISSTGSYTPPGIANAYTITAALNANPNVTGQATVYVTDFPGTFTWRNDNARSGVNGQELALSPSTVNSATFGKLFSCPVDGYVYAQPLYVANLPIPGNGTHNVVFVATENDSVYAFDADANPCQQLWKTPLIPPGEQAVQAPDQQTLALLGPSIGITGTPVIGMSTPVPYLYAVAATQTPAVQIGPNFVPPTYYHSLWALDLTTGQPVIRASGTQVGAEIRQGLGFNSGEENQRPALLLDNGIVYVAFGSYGGAGDYIGWLFGFDSTSLLQTAAFNSVTNPPGGGIWQSGGGPSADSSHNVYVVTGGGKFDPYRGGSSYSDSFLRFALSSGLSVSDYFTPCDQGTDESTGNDVGASAPVLLPDSAGSPVEPHLLIGASKGGSLYVVNRDNMGKFKVDGCPDPTSVVQTIPAPAANQPILSTPLYWNNAVYVAPGNGNLISFSMNQGILAPAPSGSRSQETFGPQGATPVISANGTNNAVLWLIDASGALTTPNGPAILGAYDPSDLSKELDDSGMAPKNRDTAGLAVKFTVPTVANGKVYVGTQSELDVYGLCREARVPPASCGD
jgi:hypothetical protein